jgi:hypothetical protein
MAALHYMLDYVLRTSPSDLLPEQTSPSKHMDTVEPYITREHDHPLKKHYKDHIQRTPELTHHGPYSNLNPTNPEGTFYQSTIEEQKEQIETLERQLSIKREENRELRDMIASMKDTIASLTFGSSRKRLASYALEDDNYDTTSRNRNNKQRAKSPDLSDDDDADEDYLDVQHTPKRRRVFKSKEDKKEASVFDEHHDFHYGTLYEHKSKHTRSPIASSSETKFVLPSDIKLDKKYFLKWSGEIYAVAKAFGDRNRLRKLVAKYENETDKKASYLLDGEELRKLKALNPICHNTSYLGLYNLEFVRYFQNIVGSA